MLMLCKDSVTVYVCRCTTLRNMQHILTQ